MTGSAGQGPSRRSFVNGLFGAAALGAGAAAPPALAASAAPLPGAAAPADHEAYWRWVSDQFLIRPGLSYMNTGTRGPSPRSVVDAQYQAMLAYASDRLSFATHVQNSAFRDDLRARMAGFFGADADEIAITANTTEGIRNQTNPNGKRQIARCVPACPPTCSVIT